MQYYLGYVRSHPGAEIPEQLCRYAAVFPEKSISLGGAACCPGLIGSFFHEWSFCRHRKLPDVLCFRESELDANDIQVLSVE